MALVSLTGLSVAFDGAPALRGIDLSVAKGEAVGLVGESGCGKSVTWLAALGLLPPKARITGSVVLDGQELIGAPPSILEKVRGGRIAMIFQDPASSLNPVHRIGKQITEALALHRNMVGHAARIEAKRLLDLVGIPDATRRLDAYPHELSGGQRQRVVIARAMLKNAPILILDEATSALDSETEINVARAIQKIKKQMTIITIAHRPSTIKFSDRIIYIQEGSVMSDGSYEHFKEFNPQFYFN
jgi:peptide/nickel transport system ATP-binding protein